MRDEHDGAAVLDERGGERALGDDVEVVGRLVENQQVGRVEQDLGQRQPRLFAARQNANLLIDVVALKAESAGQIAQRADAGHGRVSLQLLEDGVVSVELLHLMLREVAERDAGAERDLAAVGR